jgi:hypothetical protein
VKAGDAYRTAQVLASHGRLDPDAITHTDMDAAADYAGAPRPASPDDRHNVRIALEAIGANR